MKSRSAEELIDFEGDKYTPEQFERMVSDLTEVVDMMNHHPAWQIFHRAVVFEMKKLIRVYDEAKDEKEFWINQGRREFGLKIFDRKNPESLAGGFEKKLRAALKVLG